MNRLAEREMDLTPVDYGPLLDRIIAVLGTSPLLAGGTSDQGQRYLVIGSDQIARLVCEATVPNPLGPHTGALYATTHFKDQEARATFNDKLAKIASLVEDGLKRATRDKPARVLARLTRDQSDWTGDVAKKVALQYPFAATQRLVKQRLTLDVQHSDDALLRLHKLTISLEGATRLRERLKQGLAHVADEWAAGDAAERDRLEDVLEQMEMAGADLDQLQKVVDEQAVGRLKRDACVYYLDWLARSLSKRQNDQIADIEGRMLADLAERLRLLEDYLADPERSDATYLVSYAGCAPVDLRDELARSDAYQELPIVGQIAGTLGEQSDPDAGTRHFTLGLHLKMGGVVMSDSDRRTSAEYHLDKFDPRDERHQVALQTGGEFFRRNAVPLAFLYFVALDRLGDLEYNPLIEWDTRYRDIFNGTDVMAQATALEEIAARLNDDKIHAKIGKTRVWLQKRLCEAPPPAWGETTRHLIVEQAILVDGPEDADQFGSFFRAVFGYKGRQALRFLTISDNAASETSLASLPVIYQLQTILYGKDGSEEGFDMAYDIAGIRTLPLVIRPLLEGADRERLDSALLDSALVGLALPYTPGQLEVWEGRAHPDLAYAFAYRFTMTLLTYMALRAIRRHAPPELFIPILRIHVRPQVDGNSQDKFIYALSKVLAHMNSEGLGRSSAQGFDLSGALRGPAPDPYIFSNGLASLYADLPKRFGARLETALARLAVVVISSRLADQGNRDEGFLRTLHGEVISLVRTEAGVQVEQRETFADTYDRLALFSEPTALVDLIGRLYEDGYHDILYLAKTPYSSQLNLTGSAPLYFMEPELIGRLVANRPGLRLYPIFFDQYAVVKTRALAQSLYVDDTRQLQRLVKNDQTTRQAVVFFNLFNGKDFGGGRAKHGYYNWVITYSTLLNMHRGVLEDAHLREGLIYPTPLKRDILTMLTLLHFARYEKAPTKKGGVTLKLNPFELILGDDPLGKVAEWPHASGRTKWNALGFLALVRKSLAAKEMEYPGERDN
jgi:hypothetical protein